MAINLLSYLPPGAPPHQRLELFMAIEAIVHYARSSNKPVLLCPAIAPQIAMASKARGIPLPMASVRGAIERLIQHR